MTPFARRESGSFASIFALWMAGWLRILSSCADDLRALADPGAANAASLCPLA